MRLGFAILILIAGCGGGTPQTGNDGGDSVDAGGTCPLYVVPTGSDLTTPVVSLRTQVMPILNANCNNAMCHGTHDMPTGGLFLGAEAAKGADSSTVRAGLVGVASQELAAMALVAAGDPEKSYLMHKLDGDQCAFAGECSLPDCGKRMPNGGNIALPVAIRDTVRRWIAQGAADN